MNRADEVLLQVGARLTCKWTLPNPVPFRMRCSNSSIKGCRGGIINSFISILLPEQTPHKHDNIISICKHCLNFKLQNDIDFYHPTSFSLWLRMPRTKSWRFLSNTRSRVPLTFLRAIVALVRPIYCSVSCLVCRQLNRKSKMDPI